MTADQDASAVATIALAIAIGVASTARAGPQAPSRPAEAGPSTTDPRDGKQYPVVTIAGMTWMARNLDHAAEGSVCPRDDAQACEDQGSVTCSSRAAQPG